MHRHISDSNGPSHRSLMRQPQQGDRAQGSAFGFDADTTLAGYLFTVIDRAVKTELAVFRRMNPRLRDTRLRLASTSFQQGMATRIADRLDQMHNARQANVPNYPKGTALTVVKHVVIEEAFRTTEIRLVTAARMRRARMNASYRDGLAAGDRVNLNRPVRDDGRVMLNDR